MLADIRDVALVVLAVESIVIGLALVLTLLELRSLTRLLRDEIAPMLDTAKETVTIVRGTTDFVGESVVRPMSKVASMGSAAKRVAQIVLGNKP